MNKLFILFVSFIITSLISSCSTIHGVPYPTTPKVASHYYGPYKYQRVVAQQPTNVYQTYNRVEKHSPSFRTVKFGSRQCEDQRYYLRQNTKLHWADKLHLDTPLMLAEDNVRTSDIDLHAQTAFWRQRSFLPLSPGDMVDIKIPDGEEFSGHHIVNQSGLLSLPYIPPLAVAGFDIYQVEEKLKLHLITNEIFTPRSAKVSVRPVEWSAIQIFVKGSVYIPGRHLISGVPSNRVHKLRSQTTGDYPTSRYLSEALRAGSGVRPDAKMDQIMLIRRGWKIETDMSGVFTGEPINDIPLVAGDQVIVPTLGCFQEELIRPSQVTPKAIRIFISNLIVPATSNSSAGVGKFSETVPYGTRLLQALVSGNCVGGIALTSATRHALLVSENPLTGESEVIERSIEELMRGAHRDDINPYVLPNDAIACYDSNVTNLRDAAKTVTEVMNGLKSIILD